MKKIFILLTILISSFIFISKPNALALKDYVVHFGGTTEANKMTPGKYKSYGKNEQIFITSQTQTDTLSTYVVRLQVCTRQRDTFSVRLMQGDIDIGYSNAQVVNTSENCTYAGVSGYTRYIYATVFQTDLINYASPTWFITPDWNYTLFSISYMGLTLLTPEEYQSQVVFDELNKNQQQTNEKLDKIDNTMKNDDIDTSGSNSFFNDFDSKDHGGLSSIVTSPLKAYAKITQKCTPINMTVFNKPITLPCCDTLFWNKSEVSAFRIIWNILLGGPILYALLVKLYKTIEGLKNPDDDRIEVTKL